VASCTRTRGNDMYSDGCMWCKSGTCVVGGGPSNSLTSCSAFVLHHGCSPSSLAGNGLNRDSGL